MSLLRFLFHLSTSLEKTKDFQLLIEHLSLLIYQHPSRFFFLPVGAVVFVVPAVEEGSLISCFTSVIDESS